MLTIPRSVILATALMATSCSGPITRPDDGDHAVVKPVGGFLALKLPADTGPGALSVGDIAPRFDTPEVQRIPVPRLEDKYRIVLLQSPENAGQSDFEASVRRIQQTIPGTVIRKIYRPDVALFLLTDIFTLEFDDTVTTPQAAKRFLEDRLSFEFRVEPDLLVDGRPIPGHLNRYKLIVVDGTPTEKALKQLRSRVARNDRVRYFWPDRIIIERSSQRANMAATTSCTAPNVPSCPSASGNMPNDPLFKYQWSLRNTGLNVDRGSLTGVLAGTPAADIGIADAWQITRGDPQIVTAILDVGVDPNHPDLVNVMEPPLDATGDNHPDPKYAQDNHGTRVAGLVAAETNNCEGMAGVAWGSRLLPVRIAEEGSAGYYVFDPDAPGDAVYLAMTAGAKVIVNAWFADTKHVSDPHLRIAVRDALSHGVSVVFSSNNYESSEPDCVDVVHNGLAKKRCRAEVTFPATLAADRDPIFASGAIVAGATEQHDQYKVVQDDLDYSPDNSGEPVWGSRRGKAMTISAPGVWIETTDYSHQSTDACYRRNFMGTSAAAPLVGGAVALLLSKYRNATPAQVKRWLQTGADPGYDQSTDSQGRPVPDIYFGAGRLNVHGALCAAAADLGEPTPPGCPPVPAFP